MPNATVYNLPVLNLAAPVVQSAGARLVANIQSAPGGITASVDSTSGQLVLTLPSLTSTVDFLDFSDPTTIKANDTAFSRRIENWLNANPAKVKAVVNS